MNNRKMILIVLAAILIGWLSMVNAGAAEIQKVNINTAAAEELAQLNGVGPVIAARIIAYREKSGPFKMPEDLMQVRGIGQKVFAANQDLIVVRDPESKKK